MLEGVVIVDNMVQGGPRRYLSERGKEGQVDVGVSFYENAAGT